MTEAVLSIGSNLDDRLGHLRAVVEGLGDRVVAVSPVYSTAPWGGVEQDDYLNAVLLARDPSLTPRDWLSWGQRLEEASGRVRTVRWGARTLDVDVIRCEDEHGIVLSADPELTLPHPRAHERAFVLVPWLDVQPEATLEVAGVTRSVAELLARLPAGERDGVRRTAMSLTVGSDGVG